MRTRTFHDRPQKPGFHPHSPFLSPSPTPTPTHPPPTCPQGNPISAAADAAHTHLLPRGQDEGAHGRGHADAAGAYVGADVAHRVKHGHACHEQSARAHQHILCPTQPCLPHEQSVNAHKQGVEGAGELVRACVCVRVSVSAFLCVRASGHIRAHIP